MQIAVQSLEASHQAANLASAPAQEATGLLRTNDAGVGAQLQRLRHWRSWHELRQLSRHTSHVSFPHLQQPQYDPSICLSEEGAVQTCSHQSPKASYQMVQNSCSWWFEAGHQLGFNCHYTSKASAIILHVSTLIQTFCSKHLQVPK